VYREAMTLLRLALPVFVVGAALIGPTRPTAGASSGSRAVTGVVHGPLAAPVVDPVHHLVYGLQAYAVTVLDEATGRVCVLTRLGRNRGPVMLAVDPGDRRVLVEALRLNRMHGPKGRQVAEVTSLADDIDATSGRVVASVPISSFALTAHILGQGSASVDERLHHGFVTDYAGHGVMVDMATGRVLARFSPGMADNEYILPNQNPNTAAVDGRSHRLFIDTVESGNQGGGDDMTVVDTKTGRVLRRLRLKLGFTKGLLLDEADGRVIESGSGNVAIVDARSGKLARLVHPGIIIDPLDVDPRLHRFFLLATPLRDQSFARHLEWIDDRTGAVHIGSRYGNYHLGNAPSYAPSCGVTDAAAARLFSLPGTNGTLDIFSTTFGSLLRRFPLFREAKTLGEIWGMAVDEGTHRLIIGGTGGALLVDTDRPYTH
jgi:hypothetical protein